MKWINVTAKFIAIKCIVIIVIVVAAYTVIDSLLHHSQLRWCRRRRQHHHHHHIHLNLMDWKVVLLIESSEKDEIKFKEFQMCVRAQSGKCVHLN